MADVGADGPFETISDLIEVLQNFDGDLPLYLRTPHDSYQFVGRAVEGVERGGERVVMLVLQEVDKP
jgi:hypothetical protein